MRRREFITLLGGAAATWPLAARAPQPAMPVIGFMYYRSAGDSANIVTAFQGGLRESGFVEGQNVTIEYRFADNQSERLPAMAADLVQRRVVVIVAGPRALDAAKAATTNIPIVFMSGADPVRIGLVSSLNRPGGNLTGVTLLSSELTAKRFALLRELVPAAATIGILLDASLPGREFAEQEVEAAARSLGIPIRMISVGSEAGLETAFAATARDGVGALFVVNSILFLALRDRLSELAERYRIPASYELREYAEAGGLMTYGTSTADAYRHVGLYAGRILKGERPATLPIQLPTKFEFLLNLKAAKAIGLEVPPGLSARADEVIE